MKHFHWCLVPLFHQYPLSSAWFVHFPIEDPLITAARDVRPAESSVKCSFSLWPCLEMISVFCKIHKCKSKSTQHLISSFHAVSDVIRAMSLIAVVDTCSVQHTGLAAALSSSGFPCTDMEGHGSVLGQNRTT